MAQQVMLVQRNEELKESIEGVAGTYLGIGAIMYGLHCLVEYIAPRILADDIGLLVYIVAPLSIFLSLLFLLLVMVCATTIDDPITAFVYSAGISYLSVPVIQQTGLIGNSSSGEGVTYTLVFLFFYFLPFILSKYAMALKITKAIAAIVA